MSKTNPKQDIRTIDEIGKIGEMKTTGEIHNSHTSHSSHSPHNSRPSEPAPSAQPIPHSTFDIPHYICVTGPTACGKTRRAVALARHINAEIISADSRQVYRDMDIGTGKDLDEYGDTPYHLIDIADAGEKYNLYRYLHDYDAAYADIRRRGRNVILCGGTGMYLEAVLSGLRLPEVPANAALRDSLSDYTLAQLTERLASMKTMHNTTDVDTVSRAIRAIEIETYYLEHPEAAQAAHIDPTRRPKALIILMDIDRDSRRRRISERLRTRLDQGMVEEVRALLDRGVDPETLLAYGLEYRYLTLYLTGHLKYDEMVTALETAIHQFAKRQMTWFRGMERRGFVLHPIPWDIPDDEFIARVDALLRQYQP